MNGRPTAACWRCHVYSDSAHPSNIVWQATNAGGFIVPTTGVCASHNRHETATCFYGRLDGPASTEPVRKVLPTITLRKKSSRGPTLPDPAVPRLQPPPPRFDSIKPVTGAEPQSLAAIRFTVTLPMSVRNPSVKPGEHSFVSCCATLSVKPSCDTECGLRSQGPRGGLSSS